MFIDSKIILYAFYLIIVISTFGVLIAAHLYRNTRITNVSVKWFRIYFLVGLIAWIFQAYKGIFHEPISLNTQAIGYILAVLALFLSVIQCVKKWKYIWVSGSAVLIVFMQIYEVDNKACSY